MDAVRFQWPSRAWEDTAVASPAEETTSEQDQASGDRKWTKDVIETNTNFATTKRRKPARRRAPWRPPPEREPVTVKDRSRVDRREKLGQNTARKNAAIAHHRWEKKQDAIPEWSKRLFGPGRQLQNSPLTGRAAETIERYFPTQTKDDFTEEAFEPYEATVFNIATNILPEVHRELEVHYHWLQHDVTVILPVFIEIYLKTHPEYVSWTESEMTREYLRLIRDHLENFHQYADRRPEKRKIDIPGERASPAYLTSAAIALVAMCTPIKVDASEEMKKTKILEIQRLGISHHRAHVKAYIHMWIENVAKLREALRKIKREEALAREAKDRERRRWRLVPDDVVMMEVADAE